jgi:hypothetical protein
LKLLHNMFPTNKVLHKIGVKESINCEFYSIETDFIIHYKWECPKSKLFWKSFMCKSYINTCNIMCVGISWIWYWLRLKTPLKVLEISKYKRESKGRVAIKMYRYAQNDYYTMWIYCINGRRLHKFVKLVSYPFC